MLDYYMQCEIYSLQEQMSIYRELMNSLITEKEGTSKEKIQKKSEAIYSLAIKRFDIEGDAIFVKKIEKSIKDISLLKPGRKLLKSFNENDINLKIKSGITDQYLDREYTVTVTGSDSLYSALNSKKEKQVFKEPFQVVLFHELVHALHHKLNIMKFYKLNILIGMTSLEEQYAITGFNPVIFSKKSSLDLKDIDIICENAFLLALNLPPRIDHQKNVFEDKEVDLTIIDNKEKMTNLYYEWLENQLTSIRTIPKDKQEDKEYIRNFIGDQPQAIQSISSRLKEDENFLLQIIAFCPEVLAYLPALRSNKDFMMKAVRYTYGAFFASRELYKDKEFVLEAIRQNVYMTDSVFNKIDDSLKKDPDIIAAMENTD